MLALDAQVVLLGVTYSNSTSHHFAEWMCDVPYRHANPPRRAAAQTGRSVVPQSMDDYQPKPSPDGSYYGSRATDFNFLGRMLEERGEATTCPVGNAIVRRFGMRELIALAEVEAARDVNVFRTAEGDKEHVTQLIDGVYVFSDPTLDGAGRPEHRLWSVVEPERIVGWRPDQPRLPIRLGSKAPFADQLLRPYQRRWLEFGRASDPSLVLGEPAAISSLDPRPRGRHSGGLRQTWRLHSLLRNQS